MVGRSAKKSTRSFNIAPEAKDLSKWTCKTCLQIRSLNDFIVTSDPIWDKTGKYPICTYCIDEAYNRYFVSEKSMEKAILKLCKALNCCYSSKAIEMTKQEIETHKAKGRIIKGVFGIYRKNLGRVDGFDTDKDLTYQEGIKYDAPKIDSDEYQDGLISELENFWGEGFTPEEYQFLETKLAEWKSSYSCQTKAEEFYMKEACHKELDLRKARSAEGSSGVDSITKSMNELLKAAALTPAQANAASSGKTQDTWGTIIKKIEETTPAEYYKDKELFKDFDNIGLYIKNYIVRSLKNFILGSKDFNVVDDESEFDDYGEVIGDANESSPLSV